MKMPIEMPKVLPFSVDTWTLSSKRKTRHFLSHAHKDHALGISARASFPIFSTLFTRTLIRRYYPQVDGSNFVGIEIGQSLAVEDPDGDFTVTAFDANHCPGYLVLILKVKGTNWIYRRALQMHSLKQSRNDRFLGLGSCFDCGLKFGGRCFCYLFILWWL